MKPIKIPARLEQEWTQFLDAAQCWMSSEDLAPEELELVSIIRKYVAENNVTPSNPVKRGGPLR